MVNFHATHEPFQRLRGLIMPACVAVFVGVFFPALATADDTTDPPEKTENKKAEGDEKSGGSDGSEETTVEVLEEVPSRFSIVHDQSESVWDLRGDGSVYRGTASVFSGAMQMVVGEGEFTASEGKKDDFESRFWLTEKRDSLTIRRDVKLDIERSGLRYLDTFSNGGDAEVELKIAYKTKFQEKPAAVFTNDGKEFDGKLEKHAGLVMQAANDSERPGIVMVIACERSETRPEIGVVEDLEYQIGYTLKVPAGKTVGLVHWLAQRKVTDGKSARGAFEEFYRRKRLRAAHVAEDQIEIVANFEVGADEAPDAPDAEDLIAVQRLCKRLDVERDVDDLLWVTGDSHLSGGAKGATLKVTGRFGEIETTLEDLAALQGGGGRGREHRVFFRDGDVLTGEIEAGNLAMQGSEGWKIDLDVTQLEYIVFKLGENDGRFGENVDTFIELHSGEVLGIPAGEIEMGFISPWGALDAKLKDITSMQAIKVPSPRYRVSMADGSEFTVFLVNRPVEVKTLRFGTLSIPANEIVSVWKAGGDIVWTDGSELEEREDLEGIDITACLLKGSNLIAGEIANEKLHLISGATVTALTPAEIISIRRSEDDLSELIPIFAVELAGGNELTGRFQERTVLVKGKTRQWSVPVQHFLAAQRIDTNEE